MPHKHKRKADTADADLWDLAPTERATALPVGKARAPNPQPKKRKTTNGGNSQYAGGDDTPKAFARLMAFSARGKGPKGLDDGPRPKKQKNKAAVAKAKAASANSPDGEDDDEVVDSEAQPKAKELQLKIMPGEKMSDFAQRVNAALPLSGIQKNGKKIAGLSDHKVTRHEKKLKKLQAGWRKEEERIKDKELEEQELAEEDMDEHDLLWEDKTEDLDAAAGTRMGKKKGGKNKGKKRLLAGEVDLKEEDPWEVLRKSREQRKGLHDVVLAPPTFNTVPREIFKVKNGAKVNVGNVPKSAGSLMKREQLGEERLTLIDTYRKLMAANREKAGK